MKLNGMQESNKVHPVVKHYLLKNVYNEASTKRMEVALSKPENIAQLNRMFETLDILDLEDELDALKETLLPIEVGKNHRTGGSSSTEFSLWMKAQGSVVDGRTTLFQQLELAVRLYDETQGDSTCSTHVWDIIATLKQQTQLDPNKLARWKGVQVDWILRTFIRSPYFLRLMEFGCELWFVRKVCMIEFLRRRGVWSGTFVDHIDEIGLGDCAGVVKERATVFLSYTGCYTLQHYADMLRSLRGEYIWMDIFCVDQFAWTGQSNSNEMVDFRNELTAGLQDRIREIKTTVLMLHKWDDTMATLSQIWVLWEVFNTFEADANFRILLPREETLKYLGLLKCSPNFVMSVTETLSRIDSQNATSHDPQDREHIITLMKNQGLDVVDERVRSKIRGWFVETASRSLATMTPLEGLIGYQNFSRLLHAEGREEEAELYNKLVWDQVLSTHGYDSFEQLVNAWREFSRAPHHHYLLTLLVTEFRRRLGDTHRDTLTAVYWYVRISKHQEVETEEKMRLCSDVLESANHVDPHHDDQLPVKYLSISLMFSLGELQKGISSLLETIVLPHKESPELLNTMYDTAVELYNCGEEEMTRTMHIHHVEQLYDEVLNMQEHLSMEEDVDWFLLGDNLGCHFYNTGEFEKAGFWIRKVIRGRSMYPARNEYNQNSMFSIELLFKVSGKIQEKYSCRADDFKALESHAHYLETASKDTALSFRQKLLPLQRKVLGDCHELSLQSLDNMAMLLQVTGETVQSQQLKRESASLRRQTFESAMRKAQHCLSTGHCQAATEVLVRELIDRTPFRPGEFELALESLAVVANIMHELGDGPTPLCHEVLRHIEERAKELVAAGQVDKAAELYERLVHSRQLLVGDSWKSVQCLFCYAKLLAYLHSELISVDAMDMMRRLLQPVTKRANVLFNDREIKHMNVLVEQLLKSALLAESTCLDYVLPYFELVYDLSVTSCNNNPVLHAYNNLANMVGTNGDLTSAEIIHWAVLTHRLSTLGELHLDTVQSICNYVIILRALNQTKIATDMLDKVVGNWNRIVSTANCEAACLRSEGDTDGWERLQEKSVAFQQQMLGADDPSVLELKVIFATMLSEAGRCQKAGVLRCETLFPGKESHGSFLGHLWWEKPPN